MGDMEPEDDSVPAEVTTPAPGALSLIPREKGLAQVLPQVPQQSAQDLANPTGVYVLVAQIQELRGEVQELKTRNLELQRSAATAQRQLAKADKDNAVLLSEKKTRGKIKL